LILTWGVYDPPCIVRLKMAGELLFSGSAERTKAEVGAEFVYDAHAESRPVCPS